MEEKKTAINIPDEKLVSEYYEYRQQLDQMGADFREVITHPTYSLPFLQPGRLVKVKYQKLEFGWGVVISYQKRLPPKVSICSALRRALLKLFVFLKNRPMPATEDIPPHQQYIVDVLLYCSKESHLPKERNITTPTPGGVIPCPPGEKGEPLVVPVLLSTIEGLSLIRIFLPKDLRPLQARETAWKSVLEVQRRMSDGVPLLDPVQNMGIKDEKFKQLVKVSNSQQSPYHCSLILLFC